MSFFQNYDHKIMYCHLFMTHSVAMVLSCNSPVFAAPCNTMLKNN